MPHSTPVHLEPGRAVGAITLSGVLSAIPGLVALAVALIGIGRASQRLRTLEKRMDEVAELKDTVSRIDERTKQAKEDHRILREEVRAGNDKLDRLIERRQRTN